MPFIYGSNMEYEMETGKIYKCICNIHSFYPASTFQNMYKMRDSARVRFIKNQIPQCPELITHIDVSPRSEENP